MFQNESWGRQRRNESAAPGVLLRFVGGAAVRAHEANGGFEQVGECSQQDSEARVGYGQRHWDREKKERVFYRIRFRAVEFIGDDHPDKKHGASERQYYAYEQPDPVEQFRFRFHDLIGHFFLLCQGLHRSHCECMPQSFTEMRP